MNASDSKAVAHAVSYANANNLTIENSLGGGYDGVVLGTHRRTAIKAFLRPELYRQELDVYLRFDENGFVKANDFHVPRLIENDDNLCVIEMTIVSPPFIVDFACARLDDRGPFDSEIREAWIEEKKEQFEGDWPTVKRALWTFEAIGVYLNDVTPRNVHCR